MTYTRSVGRRLAEGALATKQHDDQGSIGSDAWHRQSRHKIERGRFDSISVCSYLRDLRLLQHMGRHARFAPSSRIHPVEGGRHRAFEKSTAPFALFPPPNQSNQITNVDRSANLESNQTPQIAMLPRPRARGAAAPALLLGLLLLLLGNTAAFLQPAGPTPTTRGRGAVRMMAKKVSFGDKGLDQLVAGINVVGNAVKVRAW